MPGPTNTDPSSGLRGTTTAGPAAPAGGAAGHCADCAGPGHRGAREAPQTPEEHLAGQEHARPGPGELKLQEKSIVEKEERLSESNSHR